MANIVFISDIGGDWGKEYLPYAYTQSFVNALEKMGNDVRFFLTCYNRRDIAKECIKNKPDIIFAMNNYCIGSKLLRNTDCPIFMVVSDSLPFLASMELVEKYIERYYFLHASEDSFKQIKELFPDLPENKNIILGHATGVYKKDVHQDIDISFIGSMGNWNKSISYYFSFLAKKLAFDAEDVACLNKLKNAFTAQYDEFVANPLAVDNDFIDNTILPDFSDLTGLSYSSSLVLLRACNLRYEVLSSLTDLGLKIFSVPWGMPDVVNYNMDLFKCFDFSPSISLEDTEQNFNRSKISLNLPHSHVVNGFSWRVPDVLASNACLLSDFRPDLKRMMKGYIDIPMYQSPAEARDLAIKLLKDEAWRKDIVTASQQMIEDNCRFEKLLQRVQDISGVQLFFQEKQGSQKLFSIEKIKNNFLPVLSDGISHKKCFKGKYAFSLWKKITYMFLRKNMFQSLFPAEK